ncbi:hypothetical protein [Streptomyces griseorubiginosus]|uniref:hypothetical protein n=1 Tax=Streptomyces griseorubiginosus TaxID=67304 RepID=UPI00332B42A8
MDPVTLVTTALVAGGAAGISGTASRAVQDSYQALIDAVRRKISGVAEEQQARPEVLDAYLADPVGHYERLVCALVAAHADRDTSLADAARAIFALTHPGERSHRPTYNTIDARHAQGLVVGNGHVEQTNHFSG